MEFDLGIKHYDRPSELIRDLREMGDEEKENSFSGNLKDRCPFFSSGRKVGKRIPLLYDDSLLKR